MCATEYDLVCETACEKECGMVYVMVYCSPQTVCAMEYGTEYVKKYETVCG